MSRRNLEILAVVCLLPLLAPSVVRAQTAAPLEWDAAAAGRYLEARMDLWWQRAKPLATAGSEQPCLSCHTAVPYVLARQAMREAGESLELSSHEARIVDVARARVAAGSDAQPYYDQNESKVVESRGVEAVLNAFVLTIYASAPFAPAELEADARAALTRLWALQRADGAWDWLDFGLEPYEAPDAVYHGATLAALAAGSRAGRAAADATAEAGVERFTRYLTTEYPRQSLFNRTWALLAAARLDGVLAAGERAALLEELRAKQRGDGGWSLADLGVWRWRGTDAPFVPPGTPDPALLGRSDGFATGLVVYALREAGTPIDDPSVQRAQQWLRSAQAPDPAGDPSWAPWRAHSLNHDREHGGARGEAWRRMFMSDLATAFAVLALR